MDETSENTMETMRIPYFKVHSMFFPSDDIDPSVMSFPMNKQKMIFTAKNKNSPKISIESVFIKINETMNTNAKKKYLMNDFVSDIAIYRYILRRYVFSIAAINSRFAIDSHLSLRGLMGWNLGADILAVWWKI